MPYSSEYARVAYRKSLPHWTRIEMLLELYAATIRCFKQAKTAIEANNEAESTKLLMRATQFITCIESGLDPNKGTVAENVVLLCQHCRYCLAQADVNSLESAIQVLQTLEAGFVAIRQEANQLESSGQIKPLSLDAGFETMA